MRKIYLIADIHTLSAFRLAGVEGIVSDNENALSKLNEIINKTDAGIVAITQELGRDIQDRITEINLTRPSPAVIAIPGIDDAAGFNLSMTGHTADVLGISL